MFVNSILLDSFYVHYNLSTCRTIECLMIVVFIIHFFFLNSEMEPQKWISKPTQETFWRFNCFSRMISGRCSMKGLQDEYFHQNVNERRHVIMCAWMGPNHFCAIFSHFCWSILIMDNHYSILYFIQFEPEYIVYILFIRCCSCCCDLMKIWWQLCKECGIYFRWNVELKIIINPKKFTL